MTLKIDFFCFLSYAIQIHRCINTYIDSICNIYCQDCSGWAVGLLSLYPSGLQGHNLTLLNVVSLVSVANRFYGVDLQPTIKQFWIQSCLSWLVTIQVYRTLSALGYQKTTGEETSSYLSKSICMKLNVIWETDFTFRSNNWYVTCTTWSTKRVEIVKSDKFFFFFVFFLLIVHPIPDSISWVRKISWNNPYPNVNDKDIGHRNIHFTNTNLTLTDMPYLNENKTVPPFQKNRDYCDHGFVIIAITSFS